MKVEQNMAALQERLGFAWHDESLFRLALTHGSFNYEQRRPEIESNQRLEFLGDAVLELIVSTYLYRTFPHYTEGELTRLRAALVCEPSLVRVARELNLGQCLLMGRGEEHSGGRERPSILADAVEALLGAVYLDQGLEQAGNFILPYLVPVLNDVLEGRLTRDYKTELQEILQQNASDPVTYVIIKEKGPDHEKIFTAAAVYQGREIGRGVGHSKKEAEQQAARLALINLGLNR
ncbi:MAG: ribonuclease III [Armatimonadetes bacterium]|nr:ribonuclease III [Armatimonadota bacterium]